MLNLFQNIPRALTITVAAIVAVAILVILEKGLASRLTAAGDVYSALFTFLVISSKTVIPLFLLWKIGNIRPGCLGWVKGGIFQALWKGVALAVIMLVVGGLYQKYSFLIFGTPYVSTGSQALQGKTSAIVIGLLLSAALLNAFGEEIIFRGMLLPVLSNYGRIGIALMAQSLIFTAYHLMPLQNSMLLFIIGILFGLGYLWSGSLLTPVIAHLIENGAGAIIFLTRHLQS